MQGLRTTIYKVSDLEEANNWYSKAFKTKPYFNESFYVGFNIGGYELGLLPEVGDDEASDNVLSYWGVEDIYEVYNQLIQCGATQHESPNDVGGEITVASVRDPWNNVIGIIYNPNFQISSTR